jgi:hypothetical protein
MDPGVVSVGVRCSCAMHAHGSRDEHAQHGCTGGQPLPYVDVEGPAAVSMEAPRDFTRDVDSPEGTPCEP